MRVKMCAWSVCGLLSVLLTLPVSCPAADTIRINGSGSALDMMKPLVAAYQKSNRDAHIVMEKPLGSSGAVKALLADALDLVISSKPLKPDEIARGAQLQPFGKTPLVIITEKNVGKKDITIKELEDIHTGKSTTWPNGEAIRLIMRPQEDVDSKILSSLSPGMAIAMSAARSRPGMLVAVTDPEAYATVSKTPGGIGATGLTSIIVEKIQITPLTLNGIKALPKTLASGAYPLSKEISLVTSTKTPPAAHKLINFILSPQGRAIAEKCGVFVTSGATVRK
ncbi:MAG: substrate-binding domain-containing protein [Desulfuromonadales bacterium]|nr:substrate-binding domain-containing protein [Desulfuromonadales bacterium]